MPNPILQAINGMRNPNNNILGLMSMLKSGNPDAIFNQLKQTNPQFKKFVEDNQNKSVQQIAQENGIDINIINQFLR